MFYILVTVLSLLIPKTFVMISRAYGLYQPWKERTIEELIRRDQASVNHMRMKYATLNQQIEHIQSDFVFTMKAYFFRLCEMVNDASLFYPLYCSLLYLVIFPWFLGDFVPSSDDPQRRWGYAYIYGIKLFDGSWQPLLDTWLLAYLVFPLIIYISFSRTSPKVLYCPQNIRYSRPIHLRWYVKALVVFACAYHVVDCVSLGWVYYGPWAMIISPKTWFTVWAISAVYRCQTPPSDPMFDKDKKRKKM